MKLIKHWLKQWWVAFDQLCNACIPSWETWADETFSSRCYRLSSRSTKWAKIESVVDTLFFWETEHCRNSFESERLRRQSPPETR